MSKISSYVFLLLLALLQITSSAAKAETGGESLWSHGSVVKREQRRTLVSTEYGHISAVRVTDNINGSYLLHFFTLKPNALFLPVVLHADMIFYIHTGSGRLSWTEEDDLRSAELRHGDVYRLQQGSVFFLQNNLQETETERRELRLFALFTNEDNMRAPVTVPYSSLRDMVLGFDRKVLQAAFKVPEEVIDELMSGTEQPAITGRVVQGASSSSWEIETAFVRGLLGRNINYEILESNKKKKKKEASSGMYNLFEEERDIENCNGWITTATRKKLSALKDLNVGLFMVNLAVGSMMGPHWNPVASEVSVVLQGRGMVRVVCSSVSGEKVCNNKRFEVGEGDVFIVPRFHPVAQMAFNNETLVFMGFSMGSGSDKKNYPRFLAGKDSVLRTLDRDVLAMSFNATNTTAVDRLLASQEESVILSCVSCAEEAFRMMEEERGEGGEREQEEGERERRREQEEEERGGGEREKARWYY